MGFTNVGKLPADSYYNLPPKSGGSLAMVRATVVYTNTDETAFAELPEGSVVVDYFVDVKTGFTGTGTDLLTVGTEADPDRYVDDLDVSSTGRFRAGAGGTTPITNLNEDPFSVATTLVYQYADANADAGAGEADIYIIYLRAQS